jgi:integrase/recombinase XerD
MNEVYKNRLIDELQLHGLSPATIQSYFDCVKLFMNHFRGRTPSQITVEDIKSYHRVLRHRGQSYRYINIQMAAIRCFFKTVVRRNQIDFRQIPNLPERKKLPVILSREDIKKIICAAENPKHRAMIYFLYGTGIRINELIHLKTEDIDAKGGVATITTGKGGKQRIVPYPHCLDAQIRAYWRRLRPRSVWLFPGVGANKISRSDYVSKIFRYLKVKSGVKARGGAHLLRHAYASHSLESGVDLRTLQMILGHRDIATTCIYLQVSKKTIGQAKSPLEFL